MFDTHAVARSLTDAGLEPEQARAVTDAVRQAAEHGDHVTPDRLDAGVAEVMAAIAASETRTVRWIVATGGAVVVAMRLFAWLVKRRAPAAPAAVSRRHGVTGSRSSASRAVTMGIPST